MASLNFISFARLSAPPTISTIGKRPGAVNRGNTVSHQIQDVLRKGSQF